MTRQKSTSNPTPNTQNQKNPNFRKIVEPTDEFVIDFTTGKRLWLRRPKPPAYPSEEYIMAIESRDEALLEYEMAMRYYESDLEELNEYVRMARENLRIHGKN